MKPQRKARIEQRARGERKQQQRFVEPLTNKRAQHIASAETGLAYKETQRQNANLIRGSQQREKQVGDWYKTFADEIAASRGQVAGAYGQAGQQIAGNIQAAGADNAARNAAMGAQEAQFSQLTGAPQNTAGPRTDAAAAGQRQLYGATLAAPVATQGANAFASFTNQKNTASGEGLSQKVKQHRQTVGYQQDRKALLKEKGQFRTQKLDELRKGERDYGIQRAAVGMEGKKFGAEQRAGAAEAAREGAQQAKENQFEEQKLANEGKKIRNEGKGDGKGGLTPSEKRDLKEGRRNALVTTRNLYHAAKKPPRTSQEWAAFTQLVASEEEISPSEAQWAVKVFRKRHPSGGGGGTGDAQGGLHR